MFDPTMDTDRAIAKPTRQPCIVRDVFKSGYATGRCATGMKRSRQPSKCAYTTSMVGDWYRRRSLNRVEQRHRAILTPHNDCKGIAQAVRRLSSSRV